MRPVECLSSTDFCRRGSLGFLWIAAACWVIIPCGGLPPACRPAKASEAMRAEGGPVRGPTRLCPPAHAPVTSPRVRVAGCAGGREASFSSSLTRCTDGPTSRNEPRRPSTRAAASANACARVPGACPIKLGGSAPLWEKGLRWGEELVRPVALPRPGQQLPAPLSSQVPSQPGRTILASARPRSSPPLTAPEPGSITAAAVGSSKRRKDPIWAPSVSLTRASPSGVPSLLGGVGRKCRIQGLKLVVKQLSQKGPSPA